jgi:NitT/TauT family transport system permease protein
VAKRPWVAGSPTASSKTAYRLRIPRVFAALVLISLTGIAIFVAPSLMTGLLPYWHDSAIALDL